MPTTLAPFYNPHEGVLGRNTAAQYTQFLDQIEMVAAEVQRAAVENGRAVDFSRVKPTAGVPLILKEGLMNQINAPIVAASTTTLGHLPVAQSTYDYTGVNVNLDGGTSTSWYQINSEEYDIQSAGVTLAQGLASDYTIWAIPFGSGGASGQNTIGFVQTDLQDIPTATQLAITGTNVPAGSFAVITGTTAAITNSEGVAVNLTGQAAGVYNFQLPRAYTIVPGAQYVVSQAENAITCAAAYLSGGAPSASTFVINPAAVAQGIPVSYNGVQSQTVWVVGAGIPGNAQCWVTSTGIVTLLGGVTLTVQAVGTYIFTTSQPAGVSSPITATFSSGGLTSGNTMVVTGASSAGAGLLYYITGTGIAAGTVCTVVPGTGAVAIYTESTLASVNFSVQAAGTYTLTGVPALGNQLPSGIYSNPLPAAATSGTVFQMYGVNAA
jgi:hypothetical protein